MDSGVGYHLYGGDSVRWWHRRIAERGEGEKIQ